MQGSKRVSIQAVCSTGQQEVGSTCTSRLKAPVGGSSDSASHLLLQPSCFDQMSRAESTAIDVCQCKSHSSSQLTDKPRVLATSTCSCCKRVVTIAVTRPLESPEEAPLTFMAALFSFLLARRASLSDFSCRNSSYSCATRAGSAALLRSLQFSAIICTLSRINLKSSGTLYAGAGAAAPSWLLLLVEAVLLLLLVVTSAAAALRCQLPRWGSRLNAV